MEGHSMCTRKICDSFWKIVRTAQCVDVYVLHSIFCRNIVAIVCSFFVSLHSGGRRQLTFLSLSFCIIKILTRIYNNFPFSFNIEQSNSFNTVELNFTVIILPQTLFNFVYSLHDVRNERTSLHLLSKVN